MIIEIEELKKMMNEPNIRFVDCRYSLNDPYWGEKEYKQAHLSGAIYMDLNRDLSGKVGTHGGRHPLPDMKTFKGKLERYGITNDSVLIAYDQGGAPFASRFWWLMKYIGHKEVYIVNGGYEKLAKDFKTESEISNWETSTYSINLQPDLLAEIDEVRLVAEGKKDAILIDSREYRRYSGEIEPIDKKAGHIPGAINKDWQLGVQNGQFKSKDEQYERFNDLPKDKEIIVYCGSGVTATPNMLLLKNMGYEKVKLYIGSFSDWVSYDENKIETIKDEK